MTAPVLFQTAFAMLAEGAESLDKFEEALIPAPAPDSREATYAKIAALGGSVKGL